MAIQDEIEKLRREWEQAGLNPAEFDAWRQGATHEEHLVERGRSWSGLAAKSRSRNGARPRLRREWALEPI